MGVYFWTPFFPARSKEQPAAKDIFSVARNSIAGRSPMTVCGVWYPWIVLRLFQVQLRYISNRATNLLLRGKSAARLKVTYSRERTLRVGSDPIGYRLTGLFSQMLLYTRKGFSHLYRLI